MRRSKQGFSCRRCSCACAGTRRIRIRPVTRPDDAPLDASDLGRRRARARGRRAEGRVARRRRGGLRPAVRRWRGQRRRPSAAWRWWDATGTGACSGRRRGIHGRQVVVVVQEKGSGEIRIVCVLTEPRRLGSPQLLLPLLGQRIRERILVSAVKRGDVPVARGDGDAGWDIRVVATRAGRGRGVGRYRGRKRNTCSWSFRLVHVRVGSARQRQYVVKKKDRRREALRDDKKRQVCWAAKGSRIDAFVQNEPRLAFSCLLFAGCVFLLVVLLFFASTGGGLGKPTTESSVRTGRFRSSRRRLR